VSKLILVAVIVVIGGLFSLGGLRISLRSVARLVRSRPRRQGRLLLRRDAFSGVLLVLGGLAVAVLAVKLML
jgi:hypothetical protein